MCCSYVGARFRSQYLSHMIPNLGGFFFLLGQGEGCAQLHCMNLKNKLMHILLAP